LCENPPIKLAADGDFFMPAIRLSKAGWFVAVVATIAVLAVTFTVVRQVTSEPTRAEVISLAPVNDRMTLQDDGFAGSAIAVSPDGRRVVFQAVSEGVTALWLRELDEPIPTMIPGTENGAGPFWSPDGSTIGFNASGKLKRIALWGGGPATPICDVGLSARKRLLRPVPDRCWRPIQQSSRLASSGNSRPA
jgi:hypothetical protein